MSSASSFNSNTLPIDSTSNLRIILVPDQQHPDTPKMQSIPNEQANVHAVSPSSLSLIFVLGAWQNCRHPDTWSRLDREFPYPPSRRKQNLLCSNLHDGS